MGTIVFVALASLAVSFLRDPFATLTFGKIIVQKKCEELIKRGESYENHYLKLAVA